MLLDTVTNVYILITEKLLVGSITVHIISQVVQKRTICTLHKAIFEQLATFLVSLKERLLSSVEQARGFFGGVLAPQPNFRHNVTMGGRILEVSACP